MSVCIISIDMESAVRTSNLVFCFSFPHSCTVHLENIESFTRIYPADAQLDCSKNVKIYIKIYRKGVATCFDFSRPTSGS
jgi:hypothetical protein